MRLIEELTGLTYHIPNWLAEKNGIDRREMFLQDESDRGLLLNFGFDEQLGESKKVWIPKSQCRVTERTEELFDAS